MRQGISSAFGPRGSGARWIRRRSSRGSPLPCYRCLRQKSVFFSSICTPKDHPAAPRRPQQKMPARVDMRSCDFRSTLILTLGQNVRTEIVDNQLATRVGEPPRQWAAHPVSLQLGSISINEKVSFCDAKYRDKTRWSDKALMNFAKMLISPGWH